MVALPPIARNMPVVGSIPYLVKHKLDFLEEAQREHGDIFRLNVGLTELYVMAHPRHVQHVLRDNARNYDKGGKIWDLLRVVGGNGLASTNNHDFWLRQRRMMQPHFHQKRLNDITELMVEAIDSILPELDALARTGQQFDITRYINKMTIAVIVRTVFGSSLTHAEMESMGEDVEHVFDYLIQGSLTLSAPDWMPLPGKRRFQEALQRVSDGVYTVLERKRQNPNGSTDLLSMLIDMVDEETNEQMTDAQLHDEAITLFIAGYETTASALQWVLYYLNDDPTLMRKLCQEVDTIIGQGTPTFKDIPQLDFSRRVMQEALRIRPSIFWVVRNTVADDEIDGYYVPEGKLVVLMSYLVHRHPEIWEDPEVFDPDRFLPERMKERDKLAWIPFGAGQRQCIGRDFAIMEGQLILTRLMQNYRMQPSAEHTVKAHVSTSLRTNGIWVCLEKRR